MPNKNLLLTAALMTAAALAAQAQRSETTLTDDWQFSRDGQTWQTVTVPHDWAIGGPFDKKWDLQSVAIAQNGETKPTEKSGRSGALPWIGEGHYRRTIHIPQGTQHAELLFDGAMAEPTVSLNGHKAGYWAYGYNTFRVDLTPHMKAGDNLVEVDLRNVEESSRWYPGAGIYRPVTLILTPTSHIDDWSTYVHTIEIAQGKAIVQAEGRAVAAADGMHAVITIADADGRTIVKSDALKVQADGSFHHTFTVQQPRLWTPETPYLYQVRTELQTADGRTVDRQVLKTGIRTVSTTRENGFQLNGQTLKLQGVCLHHDLGPLGAAVNKAALIRQIKTLKEMGCNAIRTSHNMPSQMQMQLCDSLGMMVMAESFDMWVHPKCKNGYARFFEEWWQRDVTNLVVANRNHPAIVMWSIGNEIWEQGLPEGRQWAVRLQGLCNALDPSRPVTQGMDHPDAALDKGFAQAMQVPGYNYHVDRYEDGIRRLPQGFLLGSETASTVSSRGVYKFPVQVNDNAHMFSWHEGYSPERIATESDGQCSGYDVEYCPWSNLPDDDWAKQEDLPYMIGEFVWTGYDYLGEPSPYDEYWPSRSSYFGIMDLAGLPKDRYWLYRSHWNRHQHTIHLLPHWTWGNESGTSKGQKSRRGEVTPVYCYTDYPTGELFLNGKSQGRITKDPKSRLDRYRLRWNDVRYEPGELRVVVYDQNGQKAGEQTLRTAGKPARLQLDAWTQHTDGSPLSNTHHPSPSTQHPSPQALTADGQDMAFVTVSLVDRNGTLVPGAADQLTFEVTGAGSFEAVCNGDATSLEPFTQPTMRLFHGQLVVVLRAAKEAGALTLKVSDRQRKLQQTITIDVKQPNT